MQLRFLPARAHHARAIIGRLRERDRAELLAYYGAGADLLHLAEFSLAKSTFAEVCLCEADLLGIYGLVPLTVLGNTSQVWLMVSEAVDRYPRAFLRASRLALERLYRRSSALTNFVDLADPTVGRWLEWLGARYLPNGKREEGHLFGQFILRSPQALAALQATDGATCLLA